MNRDKLKRQKPDETLMVTSLLYFEDALRRERFEECAELAHLAKSYGAKQSEINKVIAAHVRRMRKRKSARSKNKIRKRF